MSWLELARARVAEIRSSGLERRVRDFDARGPRGTLRERGEVISFASNDYLGLAAHPQVIAGARAAAERWGAGSGSARLIVGSRPVHSDLEEAIAEWKSKQRALLFPNGYAANLGVLGTLGREAELICSDELNHASIVDGCRMARTRVEVYPHKDVDAVDALLRGSRRAIVVTDSVFSMDGDLAPVAGLTEVCEKHGAMLVLDEAHAVLGPHPERCEIDRLRVGTLSKFLGAMGGYVAADAPFVEWLTSACRPFIFTTAGSPADAGAALAALRILRGEEGDRLVQRLRALIDKVLPGHPSPIISVVIGDEREALRASEQILERGFLVPAIRPPSVAPGTSRLRLTLSAAHTDAQVDELLIALKEIGVDPAA